MASSALAPATVVAGTFAAGALPVLAGPAADPVTPPANSRRAARTLPRSTFVATNGLGHGAVLKNECPLGIFGAFLTDPTAPVDVTCAKEMLGPAWVT